MEITDKSRLEAIRKKYGYRSSCYSFNAIYVWQKYYNTEVIFDEDAFYVRNHAGGENNWYFPCGSQQKVKKFIDSHIDEPNFKISNLSNAMVIFLEENYPDMFEIERKRDEDMYILSIEEHMKLEGGTFRHLRKKLNCFKRHAARIVKVDESNHHVARSILFYWREQRPNGLDTEYDAAEDIIMREYKELGIEMYIVYVDDEALGVIGGYEAWEDCIDVCFAKRLSNDRGVNYGMENLFFAQFKDRYRYADIEEDLGIINLRKAKMEFKPAYMEEISTAARRQMV